MRTAFERYLKIRCTTTTYDRHQPDLLRLREVALDRHEHIIRRIPKQHPRLRRHLPRHIHSRLEQDRMALIAPEAPADQQAVPVLTAQLRFEPLDTVRRIFGVDGDVVDVEAGGVGLPDVGRDHPFDVGFAAVAGDEGWVQSGVFAEGRCEDGLALGGHGES